MLTSNCAAGTEVALMRFGARSRLMASPTVVYSTKPYRPITVSRGTATRKYSGRRMEGPRRPSAPLPLVLGILTLGERRSILASGAAGRGRAAVAGGPLKVSKWAVTRTHIHK